LKAKASAILKKKKKVREEKGNMIQILLCLDQCCLSSHGVFCLFRAFECRKIYGWETAM